LLERGVIMPQGRRKLELHLETLLARTSEPNLAGSQLVSTKIANHVINVGM
jgi:hypothetical protein